jgi:GTP-binding protein
MFSAVALYPVFIGATTGNWPMASIFALQFSLMEIVSATYVVSSPKIDLCPAPDRAEYAFIGRSNVGKSSLINMLCNQRNLAKTSGTPGKTQLINHFAIESQREEKGKRTSWYIVDLPGYGFAKASHAQRDSWEKMIREYILKRTNLGSLFVLIDARHGPQKNDLEFINKLGEWKVPFSLVFTKADKETQKVVSQNVKDFLAAMKKVWVELPEHYVTSAEKKLGRSQLLDIIDQMNQTYVA